MAITVTEKAAGEVKRIISEQLQQQNGSAPEKLYLRMRVVGGGCSGFQNKLDLDPVVNEKLDEVFDFHDDLNKRGFSITNPGAKSTCGCGSSFSM